MKRYFNSLLLLAIVAYLFILNIFFNPVFKTNDNYAILTNIRLGYDLNYIHFLNITFLHFLYNNFEGIEWYSLLLTSVHLFVIWITLSIFKNTFYYFIDFICFSLGYLFIYSYFIIFLGYTSTSILTGCTALNLFLYYDNNNNLTFQKTLLIISVLIIAIAIRMKAFVAVSIVAIPFILYVLIVRRNKNLCKICVIFIIFTSSLVFYKIDNIYKTNYSSIKFQQYNEFNKLRGKFHGFPIVQANYNNTQLLEKLGWDQNDYIRLSSWMFFDEEIYNTDTLKNLIQNGTKHANVITKDIIISHTFMTITNYYPFLFLFLTLPVLSFLSGDKSAIYFNMLSLSYFLFLSTYMSIYYRFPIRIAYPILFSGFLMQLLITVSRSNPYSTKFLKILAPITLIIILKLFISFYTPKYDVKDKEKDIHKNIIETLNSDFKNYVILLQPGAGINFKYETPFKLNHIHFQTINVGWNTFSPRFYHQINILGIDKGSMIIEKMARCENCMIIANDYWLEMVLDYSSKKGIKLIPTIIKQIDGYRNGQLYLYQIRERMIHE